MTDKINTKMSSNFIIQSIESSNENTEKYIEKYIEKFKKDIYDVVGIPARFLEVAETK